MSKINELLSKVLGENADIQELSQTVEGLIDDAKGELEKDYNSKLEEAYSQLAGEMKEAEAVAYKGYSESYTMIADLRNRLETQRAEFDAALDEGYEEAYKEILKERTLKESVETDLYGEYDKKLSEMKEYMIDKIDEFLQLKGKEIYEQARRDVINDPRMAEHRVALNKVVETVADYISDEDYALATSTKLSEAVKERDDLKNQMKILEARNIRVSTENNKLTEQVRQSANVLREHAGDVAKKERLEKSQQAEGRGRKVTDRVEVIGESTGSHKANTDTNDSDQSIVESFDPEALRQMQTLAGVRKPE